jgi:hypothetical protein
MKEYTPPKKKKKKQYRFVILRDAPDSDLSGYPANLKAGYRISGST